MLDRKVRLIKEIIDVGKLSEYEEIITELIEKIMHQGFAISTRDDSTQSVTRWTGKRIIISLKKDPLPILWDLFHEFGHLISGEKSGVNIIDYDREVRAWGNALAELSKHSILLHQRENFDNYRAACLKTYDNNLNRPFL